MPGASPLDGKRCLVTGGAGFLGRNLVAALQAKGCLVHVLDMEPSPEPRSDVRWFQGDVRKHADVLAACEGVDTVFHTAAVIEALTHARRSVVENIESINIGGTRNVIRVAQQSGVRRLVRAPFSLPFQALGGFSKHYFDAPTLFRGAYVPPNPPPWNYLPDYFLIQLPDVLWLILAIGALTLAVYLARPELRRSLWSWRAACIALLLFAVLFPPTYAILRKATIYDGLRHFLFVLPPLCVLASLAVLNLLNWLSERSKPAAYATTALLGLGVLAVVVEMVELHPYQYVYFNRTSGGLPAAASQYETEYYAHSFKELASTFADQLWETERGPYLDGDYQISSCKIEPFILMEHLPANFSFAEGKSDFYAGYLRAGCIYLYPDLPLITVVERQGVALNVVRSWRPEQEARGDRER
jgi:hypothetical protein